MPELTSLSEIQALCARHGFSLSKGFGQNFIVNPGICPKICQAAEIGPETRVLEIGPGFGTLTRELCKRAEKVLAIEVDRRLEPVLEETLAGFSNAEVFFGDVLKVDLAALISEKLGGRCVVCANLPYYITSPVLMRLLEERLPISSITAMVQLEAAARITAPPGTRQAGAISYGVHYYSRPALAFKVSPGSFYPAPKVSSAVIRLMVNPAPSLAAQPEREARLFALVKAAFSQRRKTLANAAGAALGFNKDGFLAAMENAGIPPRARAEELSLESFIRLERQLYP